MSRNSDTGPLRAGSSRPPQTADRVSMFHRPWLCAEASENKIQQLLQRASGRIACSTLRDAEELAVHSVNEVLLTEFPSVSDSAARMVELSHHTSLTVTIDHFYHAELLSRAAYARGLTMPVVIEVDLGCGECGSRPGYDTQRLAIAADRLRNLRVIGLTASLKSDWCRFPDRFQIEIQDAFGVLAHTAGLLTASGVSCSVVSVQLDQWLDDQPLHPVITEIRGPVDPGQWVRHPADEPLPTSHVSMPADSDIETRVMSRPSLMTAVVQTGFRSWSSVFPHVPSDILRACVSSPDGARVQSIGPDRTVLLVSGAARDLTIGDRVTLRVDASGNEAAAGE